MLAAKGIALNPESSKDGRGREATYRVSVHKNGSIVVGANYTQSMGLLPGDEFEIKLGYKHIRLIQLEHGEAELEDEEWLITSKFRSEVRMIWVSSKVVGSGSEKPNRLISQ